MGPGPIEGSTSNVHSLGRPRVSAESSQSRSSAVFITVTNALQRNDMAADVILANDRFAGAWEFESGTRAGMEAERSPKLTLRHETNEYVCEEHQRRRFRHVRSSGYRDRIGHELSSISSRKLTK